MKKTPIKKISDWLTGHGILKILTDNYDVPWKNSIPGQDLDDDYYANRSGSKAASPLCEQLLDDDGTITDANLTRIAGVIYRKYARDWEQAFAAVNVEYNPLENYNMIEEESPAEYTKTITPAEITETETPAEVTETITPAETTVKDKVAGYTETITPAETTVTETPTEYTEKDSPAETTNTQTPAETTETTTPAETTETLTPAETTEDVENDIYGFNSNAATDDTHSQKKSTVDAAGTTVATTQNPETKKMETDAAGTDKLTVDKAGEKKFTVDEAGTTVTEVNAAGSNQIVAGLPGEQVTTVDAAGSNVLTVQQNGQKKVEVDTAGSEKLKVDATRYLTRSGNIGVTTSQMMLESEYKLRMMYNIMDSIVFPDIDKVFTIPVFVSDCEILY